MADEHKAQQRDGERALRELLKPVSGRLAVGRLLAVVSGVLAVVPYIALVEAGDLLLTAAADGVPVDGPGVRRWLQILLAAFGARLLIYFVALLVTHLADIEFGRLAREGMVRRLASAPLSWFTGVNSGRVRKGLQDDIGTVHHLIAHQPVDGTVAVVMPVALMVYAFVVDWRLGLLSIATLPLYVLATATSMRGMGEKTVEMDKRLSSVSARMVEFVTGISVVKAFGRVGRAHDRYQQSADEFYDFYFAWVKPLVRLSALGSSFLAVPLLLLINVGGGALLVRADVVSAADVLATALIALLIPNAIETLMNAAWSRQMAGAAALRLDGLLHLDVLAPVRLSDIEVPSGNAVEFDSVSYSYTAGDSAVMAVDSVNFRMEPGTITALVGPSGSGKSTLATLLARFDDPTSGTIRLGGVPLPHVGSLYSHVGFVLQDPQLLGVSIRDNILLGRPDATEEEVRAAARAAQVLDEIDALPQGFDTVYGSDSGLSGGQAQRVAIARALLVDAPVLILDEATALTDPESQYEIQQALSTLVRGKTVLLIAHRPEVIAGVDRIVLLDSGRVLASGTHDELIDHPAYARLWTAAPTSEGLQS